MKANPNLTGTNEIPRVCGLELREDPVNVCGKVASKHIVWDRSNFSFVCAKHEAGILADFRYWMVHKMGPYCGMPGSFFDPSTNTCRMSAEGIPTTWEQETPKEEPARSLTDFNWKR